jgi:hypothetical protein
MGLNKFNPGCNCENCGGAPLMLRVCGLSSWGQYMLTSDTVDEGDLFLSNLEFELGEIEVDQETTYAGQDYEYEIRRIPIEGTFVSTGSWFVYNTDYAGLLTEHFEDHYAGYSLLWTFANVTLVVVLGHKKDDPRAWRVGVALEFDVSYSGDNPDPPPLLVVGPHTYSFTGYGSTTSGGSEFRFDDDLAGKLLHLSSKPSLKCDGCFAADLAVGNLSRGPFDTVDGEYVNGADGTVYMINGESYATALANGQVVFVGSTTMGLDISGVRLSRGNDNTKCGVCYDPDIWLDGGDPANAVVGDPYSHDINFEGLEEFDFSGLPAFLTASEPVDGVVTLSGTPTEDDIGGYDLTIVGWAPIACFLSDTINLVVVASPECPEPDDYGTLGASIGWNAIMSAFLDDGVLVWTQGGSNISGLMDASNVTDITVSGNPPGSYLILDDLTYDVVLAAGTEELGTYVTTVSGKVVSGTNEGCDVEFTFTIQVVED